MEITRNVLENMMLTYVDHKKMVDEYECELENPETDAEYMYHKGFCSASEDWLRVHGVSTNCNFITSRL